MKFRIWLILCVFILQLSGRVFSADVQKSEVIKISDSDYEIWFDHFHDSVLNNDGCCLFHVKDKKTNKLSDVNFVHEGDFYQISRLFIKGRFLFVFYSQAFGDRATGFCSKYDLILKKYLGDLQSKEIDDGSFSPDERYFILDSFLCVGGEARRQLTSQLELIEINDQGGKHYFLNGNQHPSDFDFTLGITKPKPEGRKPENDYIISNMVWSDDSNKVFFIAGQDLYWDKKTLTSDEEIPAVIPYYSLVTIDLSKGVNCLKFINELFDPKKFTIPEDAEDTGFPSKFGAELEFQNGNLMVRLSGSKLVKGNKEDEDWTTPWQELKIKN